MTKIRQSRINTIHSAFGDQTQYVSKTKSFDEVSSLQQYSYAHGVFHLLHRNRKEQAKKLLLDLHFTSIFLQSYPNIVEPLKAWRFIGLEHAEKGFHELGSLLFERFPNTLSVAEKCIPIVDFLSKSGLFSSARKIAQYTSQVHTRHHGILSSL